MVGGSQASDHEGNGGDDGDDGDDVDDNDDDDGDDDDDDDDAGGGGGGDDDNDDDLIVSNCSFYHVRIRSCFTSWSLKMNRCCLLKFLSQESPLYQPRKRLR